MAATGIAIAGLVASLVAPVTAANAAEEPLLLSSDGVSWSASLHGGLFSEGITLIPGGAYSDVLWVKSTVAGDHEISASLCDATASSPAFADSLSLTATTQAGAEAAPARFTAAPASGSCIDLLPAEALRTGMALPITLTLRMAADVVNLGTVDSSAGFSVGLTLQDSIGGGVAPTPGNDGSGALTPNSSGSGSAPTAVRGPTTGKPDARTDADGSVSATDLATPYTVRIPDGLGDVDTRAFPAEPARGAYPGPGSGDLSLEPVVFGGVAILLGVLAGMFFLILARRRRRDEDEDEAAPST
ncbi:hypothetical protein [Herbiconiux sp. L3-i23]|uniref:hypothetical protein n=1 Tax=Herbiconiux sp. L3-i23 TaxID=2905871 RepID=UPI00205A0AEF|nr:hypothetical protein [Herbiconiux sp. L3-i23]BDI23058.1 hypothetical protein L3i23_18340 [Herbiconiux sp. L3-i23]